MLSGVCRAATELTASPDPWTGSAQMGLLIQTPCSVPCRGREKYIECLIPETLTEAIERVWVVEP